MSSFSAALVAGGRSVRMGRDKCLLEVEGVPLWRRQLTLLKSLHPAELMVSCREDQHFFEAQGESSFVRVIDEYPEAGPLGGLASVLRRASQDRILALAVDMPWMAASPLEELLNQSSADGGAMYQFPDGNFEPLAAVYPKRVLPLAEECVREGRLRLQSFVRECISREWMKALPVLQESERAFSNWNEPRDVSRPADLTN